MDYDGLNTASSKSCLLAVNHQFGLLILADLATVLDGILLVLKMSGCPAGSALFYFPSAVGAGDDVIDSLRFGQPACRLESQLIDHGAIAWLWNRFAFGARRL